MPSRYVPLTILLTAALVTTITAQTTKPVQTKPAPTKPATTKSATTKPATTKPATTKPDFSGDWAYDKSKSTVVRVNNKDVDAPALGLGFSAKQDAAFLRVNRSFGSPPTAYTWTFDLTGKPTTNKLPGQNGDDEVVSRASWIGSKLVITSTRMSKDSSGKSVVTSSLKRTLSINADGTLTIDASVTPPPIAGTSNVTSVYRKNTAK